MEILKTAAVQEEGHRQDAIRRPIYLKERLHHVKERNEKMADLTTKELSALEDELSAEQLLIKKYKTYAALATDPQIKTQCEQIAGRHQNHFNRLMGFLN